MPLTSTLVDGNGNPLQIQTIDSGTNTITLAGPLPHSATGAAVTLHQNGSPTPGLSDNTTYYVINNQQGGINPITFTPTAVQASGSNITLANEPFTNGQAVVYNTTDTTPAGKVPGLLPGTTYYVIVEDANTIQLASSLANVQARTGLTLGTAIPSGTQTLTPTAAGSKPVVFDVSPLVNTATTTITLPNHSFSTGQAVTYTTNGTPLSYTDHTGSHPLTSGGTYYVVVLDADTFQFADSYSHATAATPTVLTLSPVGAGGSQSTLTGARRHVHLHDDGHQRQQHHHPAQPRPGPRGGSRLFDQRQQRHRRAPRTIRRITRSSWTPTRSSWRTTRPTPWPAGTPSPWTPPRPARATPRRSTPTPSTPSPAAATPPPSPAGSTFTLTNQFATGEAIT